MLGGKRRIVIDSDASGDKTLKMDLYEPIVTHP